VKINKKNIGVATRGSVLLFAIIVLGAMGYSAYRVVGANMQTKKFASKGRDSLHMQLFAANLKEFGKYLLFYEKVFYVEGKNSALHLDDAIKRSWGVAADFADGSPCGFYDFNLNFSGDLKIDNKLVFCPHIMRNETVTNKVLEQAFLNPYAARKSITKLEEGHYQIVLEFDKDMFSTDSFLDLGQDKYLVTKIKDTSKWSFEAKLIMDFWTEGAGITLSNQSERLVKIRSEVSLKPKGVFAQIGGMVKGNLSEFDEESFTLTPSSPRTFALFSLYPEQKDFSKDIKLSSGDEIHGKSYYAGNMKGIKISDLPIFQDVLVLGGEWGDANSYFIPDYPSFKAIKEKLKRGIISNMNPSRFLLQGCPISSASNAPRINNRNEKYKCTIGVSDLVGDLPGAAKAVVAGGEVHFYDEAGEDIGQEPGSISTEDKIMTIKNMDGTSALLTEYISSAMGSIVVGSDVEVFLWQTWAGEVDFQTTKNELYAYGMVAPAKMVKNSKAKILLYSLYNMKVGQTHISDADFLAKLNQAAYEIGTGISIPLVNFPSIYSAEKGFR